MESKRVFFIAQMFRDADLEMSGRVSLFTYKISLSLKFICDYINLGQYRSFGSNNLCWRLPLERGSSASKKIPRPMWPIAEDLNPDKQARKKDVETAACFFMG